MSKSVQNIRGHIDTVAEASLEDPPRIAIPDLVTALRLIANEIDLILRNQGGERL